MKKVNWKLGLLISVALSLIALSVRITRTTEVQWDIAMHIILFSFLYCYACWIGHSLFLLKQVTIPSNQNLQVGYTTLSILSVAVLIFALDVGSGLLFDQELHLKDDIYLTGVKKYINMALRSVLLSSLYFFIMHHLHILNEKQKHSIEIAQLKQAHLEANLSSLKEQLSPHFLFNTLNTLSTLSDEKNVKDYVSELANVYRYMLMYKKMDTATLGQELAFTESYLYIIKARLEDAIEVTIDIGGNLKSSLLAPFTLQLLIENAIKHNIASRSRRLKIDIHDEDGRYIIISNTMQPKSNTLHSTGIGLTNIMQRYQLLFGEEIFIEKGENAFTVKLPVVWP